MSTGGFLVAPAKSIGPQPILIQNNAATAQTFTLTPVATTSVSGGGKTFCLPTSTAVPWFHTDETVTVPAGKTIRVPVRVTGVHKGVDVAIAVRPVTGPGTGVALSFTSYSQQVIGGLTATGCAHIRGVAAVVHQPALPVAPIAGGAGGVLLAAILAVAVWQRRRRPTRPIASHRKGNHVHV